MGTTSSTLFLNHFETMQASFETSLEVDITSGLKSVHILLNNRHLACAASHMDLYIVHFIIVYPTSFSQSR